MIQTFLRPSRLAAIAAVPLLLGASTRLTGGTTYDFIVKSTRGSTESVVMRGRGTFAGDDAKIEITETAGPASNDNNVFGSKGSYFLVVNGGKKMLLVDPKQKTYLEWDMQNMMAGMAKMVNAIGGLVKMEMSDIHIDAKEMGPGPAIQGYPTHHVQVTQKYTISTKMFGKSSKSANDVTSDYYFAPGLRELVNPFVQNSNTWVNSFDMFNNPDYKSQMASVQAKLHGVPIKTVVTTIATDEKGKQQTSTVTTEMLNFKNIDVPASTFAIPAGFQVVEVPKLDATGTAKPGNAGENGQSVGDAAKEGAKDGVKDATQEVTQEAAKEAAKKKLRGIFKR